LSKQHSLNASDTRVNVVCRRTLGGKAKRGKKIEMVKLKETVFVLSTGISNNNNRQSSVTLREQCRNKILLDVLFKADINSCDFFQALEPSSVIELSDK
jgi:hypothetical protein